MITTLFALGTLWFWLLIIASVITITALIEKEQNIWADIVFAGTMVLLFKLGCGAPLSTIGSWIATHWIYSIGLFFAYIIVGFLYAFVKWAVFVSDGKDRLIRSNKTFYPKQWTAGENKNRITHWVIYFPINGAWTLISNPVVKVVNRIFYKVEGIFNRISEKIMHDLHEKRNA